MVVMQTQDAEIEELKSTLEHLQQKSETSSGDVTSPIATTPHHCTSASSPAALATCISLQGNKHSHLLIVCVYGEVKIGRLSVFVESVAGIPAEFVSKMQGTLYTDIMLNLKFIKFYAKKQVLLNIC